MPSDDLRTRIAKVLHQRGTARDDVEEGWTWTWEQESEYEQRSWLEDADAVIRELGLKREEAMVTKIPDCVPLPAGLSHRYVTEWSRDE